MLGNIVIKTGNLAKSSLFFGNLCYYWRLSLAVVIAYAMCKMSVSRADRAAYTGIRESAILSIQLPLVFSAPIQRGLF